MLRLLNEQLELPLTWMNTPNPAFLKENKAICLCKNVKKGLNSGSPI